MFPLMDSSRLGQTHPPPQYFFIFLMFLSDEGSAQFLEIGGLSFGKVRGIFTPVLSKGVPMSFSPLN